MPKEITFFNYNLPSLPPLTPKEKFDLITTFVVSLLLVINLGLIIHYAIHPLSPMIVLSANLSLSLPVVICGSMGCVLALALTIQICRYKQVLKAIKHLFSDEISKAQQWDQQIEAAHLRRI